MKKTVIVINGPGGAGKDTLCGIAARHYKALCVSSITPVKEIAGIAGWQGEKTPKARRFLSELKRLFTEYNDLCNLYLIDEYKKFMAEPYELLFVHIREPEEIKKFLRSVGCRKITLLVTRGEKTLHPFGNASDDGVYDYSYDHIYENTGSLESLEKDFPPFLDAMLNE